MFTILPAHNAMLAQQFGIFALLDRRFKYLSTGETRKALLCQALIMSEPELLSLMNRSTDLAVTARQQLAQRLTAIEPGEYDLAAVLNRLLMNSDFVRFAGVLADWPRWRNRERRQSCCNGRWSLNSRTASDRRTIANRTNLPPAMRYPMANRGSVAMAYRRGDGLAALGLRREVEWSRGTGGSSVLTGG